MSFTLLNIPNFCVSFYLLGLSQIARIKYSPNSEFERFNYRPLAIFQFEGSLFVIDNSDPVGLDQKLLEAAHLYFLTNKLKGNRNYENPKLIPLFPHYPVNASLIYVSIFWKNLFSSDSINTLKELYRLRKRPFFRIENENKVKGSNVFFAGSIWKNETEANKIRYHFIKSCKENFKINFEGGFLARNDGNNLGFDDALAPRAYSPKDFIEYSKKSIIGFNNPAVLGAISWRVAEYLNIGIPIVSLPFKVELPSEPIHGKNIHIIEDVSEIPEFLDYALNNHEYLNNISTGGKEYFLSYCLPSAQMKYIMEHIKLKLI